MNTTSSKKTLLVLGGSRLVVPIIEMGHELGCRVVTCDYLPDNSAHRYSDDYRNVSIVDQEAVLNTARELRADAITSFGTDPGVVSAAYTAEKLGLPFQCGYQTARTLQNKGRFRTFLAENGFRTPRAAVVAGQSDAEDAVKGMSFPVIVKPTDAAGSKGVTRVDDLANLGSAIDTALGFSLSGTAIVEEFIEKHGPQLVGEAFTVNGKLTTVTFMDHHFDDEGPNPYAPVGHIAPSSHPREALDELEKDLQRLANVLSLSTGIYNVEARIDTSGLPYIMEVSPRGGGNRLAEFISAATGTDLVRATVQAALGIEPDTQWSSDIDGVWLQRMLFDRHGGTFQELKTEDPVHGSIKDINLWIEPGDRIEPFSHASYAFGSTWIQFESRKSMDMAMSNPSGFVNIEISR